MIFITAVVLWIAPIAPALGEMTGWEAGPTGQAQAPPEDQASGPNTVTDEDVELAVQRAVDFIWSKQRTNGRWRSSQFERIFPYGMTALAAFTLRSAGTGINDYRLQRSVSKLLDRKNINTVYARAFTLMLWCALDPERYRLKIKEDVRFLTLQQGNDGGWGYGTLTKAGPGKNWTDNSNSQLALLALWEASCVGAKVNARVWRRAETSWLASVNADGGWGYPLSDDPEFAEFRKDSTGSMTAAGLASLHLIDDRLYLDSALTFNGRFKGHCGQEVEKTQPLRAAMNRAWPWLIANFRTDVVPGLEPGPAGEFSLEYLTYYLYCVDRVGVASGRKRFGQTAWYPEVARRLVGTQNDDGSWGTMYQTCFGVLALLKGRAPLLINKLQYGDGNSWNTDPRDAANLTRWFGRRFETPITWQVVRIGPDKDDLGDAPVLLITGHEAPALDETQRMRLREFVRDGGTVLAVACCSKQTFSEGCRELFKAALPRLQPGPLPEDHPIWTIHDKLAPGDDVIGFTDGCRTPVFLLTRGACCAWQQNLHEQYERRFILAGNILLYATFGRSLQGRLTPYLEDTSTKPLWTIRVARMKHGGDWGTDPNALKHLSAALSGSSGLGIQSQPPVRVQDARRSRADLLWLVGHEFTPPQADGRMELKSYLAAGGTLFASACCGRVAFDEAFRSFASDLFGADEFRQIDPNDPLITGEFAPGLANSLLKPVLRPQHGVSAAKRLEWPVLYGVKRDGRWALVYSPYDVTCGISRHACADCVGYTRRDAEALAGNLLIYAAKGLKVRGRKSEVDGRP